MSNDAQEHTFILYHYEPSLAAAAAIHAIFLISLIIHLVQLFRKRTWYFIPAVIGVAAEVTGYIGRMLSHWNKTALGPYILQSTVLLIAPAFIAASIYMVLGRLIVLLDAQKHSIIRTNWLTKIFVIGDVFSLLVQSSGAGLMATGNGANTKLGSDIVLVGLFIQVVSFGIFIVVALTFHLRVNRDPTPKSLTLKAKMSWKTMLYVLYIASGLIMVRSIFRVVEYILGFDGYLMRSEAWLYIFDASLMIIVVILFNVFHPSRLLNQQPSEDAEYGRGSDIQLQDTAGLPKHRTRN